MKKQKSPWKKLSSRVAYKNSWITVREDSVIKPDGNKGIYGVVQINHEPVYIAAVNERSELCLVNIFRYPTQSWSWELPAGHSDGQALLVAAKRELWEETSLKARTWKKVGFGHGLVGIASSRHWVFLASDLIKSASDEKQEEGIAKVKFFSIKKIREMIQDGSITDSESIAAIFKVFLQIKKI